MLYATFRKAFNEMCLSRNQMHMQVKYHLPSSSFNIREQSISGLSHALLIGHMFGRKVQVRQNGAVIVGNVIDTADMLLGYYQQMDACSRIDVLEYNQCICFVQNFGVSLSGGDLTEEAIVWHGFSYFC